MSRSTLIIDDSVMEVVECEVSVQVAMVRLMHRWKIIRTKVHHVIQYSDNFACWEHVLIYGDE